MGDFWQRHLGGMSGVLILHMPIFTETPTYWLAKLSVGTQYYVPCNEDVFILLFVETLENILLINKRANVI